MACRICILLGACSAAALQPLQAIFALPPDSERRPTGQSAALHQTERNGTIAVEIGTLGTVELATRSVAADDPAKPTGVNNSNVQAADEDLEAKDVSGSDVAPINNTEDLNELKVHLKKGEIKEFGEDAIDWFTRRPTAEEWMWLVFTAVGLLLLDVFVLRGLFPDTFRGHSALVLFWLFIAVVYAFHIQRARGTADFEQWILGYVLEITLSFDNLFVFHVVFRTYRTPRALWHKALLIWFVFTCVIRTLFFMVLFACISKHYLVCLVLGLFLIYCGFMALEDEDEDDDVANHYSVKLLRHLFGDRLDCHYDEEAHGLFFWGGDKVRASMLVPVALLLLTVDLICAVDSVGTKAAQMSDRFIACSSSVLALFLLRTVLFVMHDLFAMFELLKYGICIILVFTGIDLIASKWYTVALQTELAFIFGVVAVCIIGSLLKAFVAPAADKASLGASDAAAHRVHW